MPTNASVSSSRIIFLTAGTMVSADLGIKLENVTIDMLGKSKKVMIDKDSSVTPARCCPASAAAPERARANPAGHGQATMTRRIGDAAGRGRRNFGARSQKIVASRLCDLGASASAVRQADSLRGAAHPVINSRTSEHHIFSRPLLSVRMFGSWGRKRANASSNCAAL